MDGKGVEEKKEKKVSLGNVIEIVSLTDSFELAHSSFSEGILRGTVVN